MIENIDSNTSRVMPPSMLSSTPSSIGSPSGPSSVERVALATDELVPAAVLVDQHRGEAHVDVVVDLVVGAARWDAEEEVADAALGGRLADLVGAADDVQSAAGRVAAAQARSR